MIRLATEKDIPRILEIYSPYILNTAVSFEYTVPSFEEFTSMCHQEDLPSEDPVAVK